MACEIWGHGHRVDEAPEGTGRGKCSAKKLYADARLKAEVLSEVIEKSGEAISVQGNGKTRCRRVWFIGPTNLSIICGLISLLSIST